MSFLNNIVPNKPEAKLEGYFMALHAKSKFGKTTFAYELVKEHYKGDMSKALLVATETGYKTLAGINAVDVIDFDYVDQEDNEGKYGFIQLVDELIENKDDIPYRFVIIDTVTALERYATQYLLTKQSRIDGKRYKDITDIEWGKGYSLLAEEIYAQIERLTASDFGVLVIGHSKTKSIKQRDGFEYDYTTFNVQNKTSDIIEREADIIMYGETTLSKKSKTDKSIVVDRKLKFRSDGTILAGSRFRNFPDEIDVDPKAFMEAFTAGVASANDGFDSIMEQPEKKVEETEKPKVKKAVEKVKSKIEEVVEPEPEEEESSGEEISAEVIQAEIAEMIVAKDMSASEKQDLAKMFKAELGVVNFKKSDDVEALTVALDRLNDEF